MQAVSRPVSSNVSASQRLDPQSLGFAPQLGASRLLVGAGEADT